MGKARRNRAKGGKRSDPIAKPGKRSSPIAKPVKPPSDPELAAIREKSILPVLKDLQSSEPKSRTAAAEAVANIVRDAKCRQLLRREQIVQILLNQTLTDESLKSRAAGWEILRVLTFEEDAGFCIHLYRLDIITAIGHACHKVNTTLVELDPPFSKRMKAEQSLYWSMVESVISVLSAVAGVQDEAVNAAVREKFIIRLFFNLLGLNTTTPTVLNSVLSCMITLSEDSPEFVEAILRDNYTRCYDQLIELKDGGDGFKAVLACGILHNVYSVSERTEQNPGKDGACDAILLPTLTRTLERTDLNNLTNGRGEPTPVEILQLTMEILASISTNLQETMIKNGQEAKDEDKKMDEDEREKMDEDEHEKMDEDEDEMDDDEDEMGDDEMEADMNAITGVDDDDDEYDEGIQHLPTLKGLIHDALPLVVKLFRNCTGNDELSSSIRSLALTTLNNISWMVSCIDFTNKSNAAVFRAWRNPAQTIWKQVVMPVLVDLESSDTKDVNLAGTVMSLAWAIARAMHGEELLSDEDEHLKFIKLYASSENLDPDQDDPFQSLGVKCIGVLGQLALVAPIALTRSLGGFFVELLLDPKTPAANAVEALNQLFDVYGDESKEWGFSKLEFLQLLEEVVPKVRAMVKTIDPRKFAELRTRAEEAHLNLKRYIKYMKTRLEPQV
ncbi:hypothetical protein GGR54DRAFT_564756 [Hypoxylon sp. NC1633]|nr:hypothetical protein GGR54DRAFT_564756 [Hypoxylon sp. NC1633]